MTVKIKENAKYTSLKQSGKALFWKYGIRKVSVEEICKEAKVSKMTFYKFFSNKIALVKELLNDLANEGIQQQRDLLALDISFSEKVQKMLEMKLANTEGVSLELIQDIYRNPEKSVQEFFEQKRNEALQEFLNWMEASRAKGFIRADIKPDFILYIIGKIHEMASDKTFNELYDNQQEAIMALTRFFFYGIGVEDNPKSVQHEN